MSTVSGSGGHPTAPRSTDDSDKDESDIPFKDFLSVVAFAATITISISVTTSQGFATSGTLFGVPVNDSPDSTTVAATQKIKDCAIWLSWAAALSGLSLMLTLLLQLLMTSPSIVSRLQIKRHRLKYAFGGFSFCAIGLQGAALAMIGEALKEINYASGSMLQWSLLATGLPSLIFWVISLRRPTNQTSETSTTVSQEHELISSSAAN